MTEAIEERANTVRTTDRTSLTMDERIGSLFQPEATATTSWKSPYGMDNRDSQRQRQLEQDQRKLTNSKPISSWTVSKPSSSLIKFSANKINLASRGRSETCNVSSR